MYLFSKNLWIYYQLRGYLGTFLVNLTDVLVKQEHIILNGKVFNKRYLTVDNYINLKSHIIVI